MFWGDALSVTPVLAAEPKLCCSGFKRLRTRWERCRRPSARHGGNEERPKRCRVRRQLPCPQQLLLTPALSLPAWIIFAFYIYPASSSTRRDRHGVFFWGLGDEIPAVRVWGRYPSGARPPWNAHPANEPHLPSVPSSRPVTETAIILLRNEYLVFNNDVLHRL